MLKMFTQKDRIIGIFTSLLGAFMVYKAQEWMSFTKSDPAGPAAFPQMIGWGLVLLGALIVFLSLGDREPMSHYFPDGFTGVLRKYKNAFKVIVISCLYIFLIQTLSYPISTVLLIAGIMLAIGERNIKLIAFTSLASTFVLFIVFYYVLQVRLPMGFLAWLF